MWQAVVHIDTLAEERAEWQGVRAAFVRPDGHVAWAGAEPDDEALAAAATAALAATGR
jgi:cytochrome c1